MISQLPDGMFYLQCNSCGYAIKDFLSFEEALSYKFEKKWLSAKNEFGEWRNYCPSCREKWSV